MALARPQALRLMQRGAGNAERGRLCRCRGRGLSIVDGASYCCGDFYAFGGVVRMELYEYKVVPAPVRAEKARGAKTSAERFALTLNGLMNQLGAEGWEYIRADTLPCEERAGLTRTRTTFQNMLVFRRPLSRPAQAGATLRSALSPEPLISAPRVAAAPAQPTAQPAAAPAAAPTAAPAAAEPVSAVAPAATSASAAIPSLGGARRSDLVAE